jgi:quercetin dioxygenase-like cupin family protein
MAKSDRVIDVEAGYADPEGFTPIASPGKTPGTPVATVATRTPGKAQLKGKNLYESAEGCHLVQLAEIPPGNRKYLHRHPLAETVWYILQGEGEFYTDPETVIPVKAGSICHSYPKEWHGLGNTGTEPLRYLSVEGPMFQRPGSNEFCE